MKAIVSTPKLVLAVLALAVAWAPAATLARPGADHAAFVTQASAQGEQPAKVEAQHDSVARPNS
jgi:hypothetical protein